MITKLKKILYLFISPPTLRIRLMSLVGMVFLLTIIAIAISVYIFTYRAEMETWQNRQEESAKAAATTVGDFVDKAQSILSISFFVGNDVQDHQQISDRIIKLSPIFLEVVRLDSEGNILGAASSDQAVLGNLFTIPQAQWYRVARSGNVYYGSVQISSHNEPYLILAVPLPDGGIAAGRLRMNILQDVVTNIHFGYSGEAYLFNSAGQIIAHTNHELTTSSVSISGRPEYKAVMQTSDQQWYGTFINLDDNPVVGVSAKVPGTEWYVMTEVLQSEAFENSRNIWQVIAGILLFMFLALYIVRIDLIRSVFSPLRKLEMGAIAIGEGDIDYRIGLVRSDEIGILARAFDEMASNVGEQRRVLEQRVMERTAELSQLNMQLLNENEEKTRLNTQIQMSLKEKEILLKEIHHRVKNNLQVISSLLNLQSAQIKDPVTVQLFRDSQNRVRSMALIHEKLYQSHDLARIDFKEYIQSLSSYLLRSFAAESHGVNFRLDIDEIELEIDQAIPCGLIINELVSNSLKYAFPNEQKGEVFIIFKRERDDHFCLAVGDNGVGFPAQLDFQNTSSLGLQLVNSLVNQLEGRIDLINRGGTEFRVIFVEPSSRAQDTLKPPQP